MAMAPCANSIAPLLSACGEDVRALSIRLVCLMHRLEGSPVTAGSPSGEVQGASRGSWDY